MLHKACMSPIWASEHLRFVRLYRLGNWQRCLASSAGCQTTKRQPHRRHYGREAWLTKGGAGAERMDGLGRSASVDKRGRSLARAIPHLDQLATANLSCVRCGIRTTRMRVLFVWLCCAGCTAQVACDYTTQRLGAMAVSGHHHRDRSADATRPHDGSSSPPRSRGPDWAVRRQAIPGLEERCCGSVARNKNGAWRHWRHGPGRIVSPQRCRLPPQTFSVAAPVSSPPNPGMPSLSAPAHSCTPSTPPCLR